MLVRGGRGSGRFVVVVGGIIVGIFVIYVCGGILYVFEYYGVRYVFSRIGGVVIGIF